MWRMARAPLVWLAAMLLLVSAAISAATGIDAPFTLTPPADLQAAPVARAASGNTYAYLPVDLKQPLRLMITAMPAGEIRHRLGPLRDTQCIRLFLDELRRDHHAFFAVDMSSPLAVGAASFRRVRWTGDKGGRALTGVLSCGELAGNYYVVHYTDSIERATNSFPAIRASLQSLTPTTE